MLTSLSAKPPLFNARRRAVQADRCRPIFTADLPAFDSFGSDDGKEGALTAGNYRIDQLNPGDERAVITKGTRRSPAPSLRPARM
jgi:hypothetical protein